MKSKNLKLFYLLLLIISSVVLSSCLREGRYDGARFNGVLMSELNNRVTEYYIHQTDNSVRTISSMQSKYELTLNLFSYLATQSNDQYGYGNVYQLDVNKVENDVLIDFSHGRWFPENITNFEGFTISGSNPSHYFLKHNYDFKYKIKIVNLETHESYFIKEIVIPAKEFYGDDSYIIINDKLPKRTFITYPLPEDMNSWMVYVHATIEGYASVTYEIFKDKYNIDTNFVYCPTIGISYNENNNGKFCSYNQEGAYFAYTQNFSDEIFSEVGEVHKQLGCYSNTWMCNHYYFHTNCKIFNVPNNYEEGTTSPKEDCDCVICGGYNLDSLRNSVSAYSNPKFTLTLLEDKFGIGMIRDRNTFTLSLSHLLTEKEREKLISENKNNQIVFSFKTKNPDTFSGEELFTMEKSYSYEELINDFYYFKEGYPPYKGLIQFGSRNPKNLYLWIEKLEYNEETGNYEKNAIAYYDSAQDKLFPVTSEVIDGVKYFTSSKETYDAGICDCYDCQLERYNNALNSN